MKWIILRSEAGIVRRVPEGYEYRPLKGEEVIGAEPMKVTDMLPQGTIITGRRCSNCGGETFDAPG